MRGRFEGLLDCQWDIIKPLMPERTKRVGRPNADLRKVLSTILYVQITGCRWCDVPIGEKWAKRSTAHHWMQKKYRRLVTRWERLDLYWSGFLQISIIMIWIDKLIYG